MTKANAQSLSAPNVPRRRAGGVALLAAAGLSIMVVIAIVRLLRAFKRAVAFPSTAAKAAPVRRLPRPARSECEVAICPVRYSLAPGAALSSSRPKKREEPAAGVLSAVAIAVRHRNVAIDVRNGHFRHLGPGFSLGSRRFSLIAA